MDGQPTRYTGRREPGLRGYKLSPCRAAGCIRGKGYYGGAGELKERCATLRGYA